MVEILCFVIIALLIIAIAILIFKKPKSGEAQSEKLVAEQSIKIDNLSSNMQNLSQISTTQLQNMNAQLNNVYQSLGEMKSMSSDVENLRKVLGNVKQRGYLAEVQLGRLLEQVIPGMYEQNVAPNPRSSKRVEFAIKIPNGKDKGITWLPVDSKFPMDQYEKLVTASEGDDAAFVEECRKQLISQINLQATTIKDKYIDVPYTTNFAIMYLPTEGIYMEAVTDPDGLQQKLQERGVMIAGPSTILALLNSLSMGFNMIEINESADEIRKMLGNIKQQFEKFNKNFETIENGLATASKGLNDAKDRSRLINNALDRVNIEED